MPATVKSFEERIEEMAEDFSSVKTRLAQVVEGQGYMQSQLSGLQSQVAGLSNSMVQMQGQLAANQAQLATNQAQLAVVVARLDSSIEEFRLTRSRLDGLLTDHTAFRSKAELRFAMIRWITVLGAGLLFTWIASAFALVRTAGSWEATTQHHQKSIDEIRHEMRDLQGKPT